MARATTVLMALLLTCTVTEAKKRPKKGLSAADAAASLGLLTSVDKEEANRRVGWEPEWSGSIHVQEIDGSDPGLKGVLEARTRYSAPLVIRGIYKDHRLTKKWGNLKAVISEQAKKADKSRGPFKLSQVKQSDTPVIIYWKDQIGWKKRFDDSLRWTDPAAKLRSWHKWRYAEVKPKYFFKHFETPGKPYLYWLQKLPDDAVEDIFPPADPGGRDTICDEFAPTAELCKDLELSPGWSVWANSIGVTAQAHYDIEGVIFVEVKGRKKFTMWQPQDLK
jgi:hypothetical protein